MSQGHPRVVDRPTPMPMSSPPEICGKYSFHVDLRGKRLPVFFTVPDILDTDGNSPPSDELLDPGSSSIDMDEEANSEDAHMPSTQANLPGPDNTINIEVYRNLLTVSAYRFTVV